MRNPFDRAFVRRLADMEPEELYAWIAKMTAEDLARLDAAFEAWAHEGQLPPKGEGWRTWLLMAGRGYGKTRAGAEWVVRLASEIGRPVRIALVAATLDEARSVMVEGESGLLAVCRNLGERVWWEPALRQLRWRNGSVATFFSGENPDGLRGPQYHFAWADELAKWAKPDESWDNLQLGLRLGLRPRVLVTTTPRPIPLLKRLRADRWTVETGGRTADNLTLDDAFIDVMTATYGGTRLGRQELDGALIDDVEGALWTRGLIEGCRVQILPGTGRWQAEGLTEGGVAQAGAGGEPPPPRPGGRGPPPRLGEDWVRIVVGVDPPASATGDACGIVAVAKDWEGHAYVLEDATVSGRSPEGWAQAVASAARRHGADRVIAEANNGGEMVASLLRGADPGLPVRPVHASRGKVARAEPVAALYERGLAHHAGRFPELEDQLCGLTIGGGYEGPGRSPDRADALVWAMTELMLGQHAQARVRVL